MDLPEEITVPQTAFYLKVSKETVRRIIAPTVSHRRQRPCSVFNNRNIRGSTVLVPGGYGSV